ncbi:MAG: YncE family protein [SAR324 cluster bacterium]|nr:YncE family protein [SAR324 cluster bacterium]
MKTKLNLLIISVLTAGLMAACTSMGTSPKMMGTKFGAPKEGMSKAEYQSLVFLDPQNTIRMDWHAVQGMTGYFLIDNQGEPTVSVVDYEMEKTIKKIDMEETGNHHLWIIPGARYAYSSQRYEKDVFWVIDLMTLKLVKKFNLSMGGKKVIAPLHIGFAYTQPLAVAGNILDKKNGYLTLINTAKHEPVDIVELTCPGARDAMFSPDDSKIFTTCQNEPKGMAVVDVKSRKQIKMVPIKGGRTGAMTPNGQYFIVGASGAFHVFDTNTTELVKTIKVPGGGGNTSCLSDSSKCYGGLRKGNAVAVLDMKKLELKTVIKTGPDANRLYINPGNTRYGIFANEAGKSEVVTIIDTMKDVAIKNIITGLGPHNVAFNPAGTHAIVSTKKETVATLLDTSSADPNEWDVITTDIASGIQNNGVRWIPKPEELKKVLTSELQNTRIIAGMPVGQ